MNASMIVASGSPEASMPGWKLDCGDHVIILSDRDYQQMLDECANPTPLSEEVKARYRRHLTP